MARSGVGPRRPWCRAGPGRAVQPLLFRPVEQALTTTPGGHCGLMDPISASYIYTSTASAPARLSSPGSIQSPEGLLQQQQLMPAWVLFSPPKCCTGRYKEAERQGRGTSDLLDADRDGHTHTGTYSADRQTEEKLQRVLGLAVR